MKFNFTTRIAAFSAATLTATQAFAHHPLGGETPSTLIQGFLSGVGHPIIGLDHLAFVIAVGVAAVMAGSRFLAPLAFILATMIGTSLHLASVSLPMVEPVIALSVALIGLMIMSGRGFSAASFAALFAVAGLFHGHAYGEAVFGAETTPIVAYLCGFGLAQYLVALGAGYVVIDMLGKGVATLDNTAGRLTGGMVAGAGALMVGENVLTAIGLG